MTARALLIDSTARTVTEFGLEMPSNKQISDLVGGFFECAWREVENTLYVDEDGLHKAKTGFFRWSPRMDDWPLCGNGVLVGKELVDDEGEWIGMADVTLSIQLVTKLITWMSREQFDAWGKAHASDPAVVIAGDSSPAQIIERVGPMFARMPRPKS